MNRADRQTAGAGSALTRLARAGGAVAVLLLASTTSAMGQAPEAGAKIAPAQLELGKAIAIRDCSSCHAIGSFGDSPLREAPRFRDLYRQFEIEDLSEALAEGIVVGHGPMPVWVYEPEEVAALVGYLKSLEPQEKPQNP